jgi:uncharacterized membrane protein
MSGGDNGNECKHLFVTRKANRSLPIYTILIINAMIIMTMVDHMIAHIYYVCVYMCWWSYQYENALQRLVENDTKRAICGPNIMIT